MMAKTKGKKITELRPEGKTKLEELNEKEQRALEKWKQTKRERIGPPKFKKIGENQVFPAEQNPDKFGPQLLAATGSTDTDFSTTILSQVTSTLNNSEEAANFVSAFMHGLRPCDETETVLIAQMAGTHNLIMAYMGKAVVPGQHLEVSEDYTNRAYKLMNIFLKQMEALQRYRGKSSQQKVIVEHVHVNAGGQAVVGNIESRPRGEGDGTKNRG